MEKQLSKSARRGWTIVNLMSISFIIIFYYISKSIEKPWVFLVYGGAALIIVLLSFYKAFITTRLWKMVHSRKNDLDERQTVVLLKALKLSYSIFVVFILSLMYVFGMMENGYINVLIVGCLLYFAHVLPAAIVGWTEEFV